MSDNETKVVISGDASGASAAMNKAADAVQTGTEKIKGSLGGIGSTFQGLLGHLSAFGAGATEHTGKAAEAVESMGSKIAGSAGGIKSTLNTLGEGFAKVSGVFVTLAAVVGGGAFFKEAMSESSKMTGEVTRLSRTLGISAEEANTLNTALGDIYSDADTYTSAFQKFTMQLRRNEDGMQSMGLSTRDAAGHLRDANAVFTDAIKLVGDYKPGIDQTAAAQKLFGKSIDDVMKFQKLNNEVLEDAKQKNQELGLIVTQENVEANKKYKAAMNDVGDVMTAVMKTVGDAVMPAFTELANYLASTGPTVVAVFKGALTGLLLVFRGLQVVVKTVTAVIFEFINSVIDQVGNLSDLISNVLSGNWSKAADAAVRMKDRTIASFTNIKDAAVDAAKEASNAFANDLGGLWGDKTASQSAPGKGKKQMGDLKETKEKAPSRTGQWETELADQKVAYEKANDLRELDKAAEEKFWQDKLKTAGITSQEQLEVRKKISTEELAIMKDQRQKEDALEEERIANAQKVGLAALDARRAESQNLVALGLMTNDQMIKEDEKLEDERSRITKQGIDARIALLMKDPTKNVVALRKLNDDLDAEEQEHSTKMRALEIKGNQEMVKDYQDAFNKIGSAFSSTVTSLMTHQMTWAAALKSMMASTLSTISNFITQILVKKAAAWATEKALTMAGISADAAKAGSGAASSQASIPYVGPILAVAAMAAIFAATMGMQSNVKSARGGYSIPSGVNPLVQTHEEEMILPKAESNAIRDMANGSNSGGLTLNGVQMPGGFWMMHQDELMKVVGNGNKYNRGRS